MGLAQWFTVLVTVGLNALDGFDVLSISFAGPGIAAEWGVDQATLGWILAMELLGMAVGSIILGMVGDKAGRRTTILFCLVVMAIGMFGAGQAAGVTELLSWRLLTGLGIGGMLAVTTAAAAEYSNLRWRGLAMAFMVIGYPIGGILGGIAVRSILADGTWHDIFTFGGWATAAFIPIVYFLVPESPVFMDRLRKPGALDRINKSLARFGHPAAAELTPVPPAAPKQSLADVFKSDLIKTTVLVTGAYFALITSFYFLVKWVPKIIVDMGFEPSAAAGVLAWRRYRRRALRFSCDSVPASSADDRRADRRCCNDLLVRQRCRGSCCAHGCRCLRGLLHEFRDLRDVLAVREGLPDTRPVHGHRLCNRCWSWWLCFGAGNCGLPVSGWIRSANRCSHHGLVCFAGGDSAVLPRGTRSGLAGLVTTRRQSLFPLGP